MEAGTQRTDDAAMLTKQIECLRDQLGHAGFAIGAGNTDQVQVMARLAIKAPGDVGQLRRQAFDRNQRHFGDRQHGGAFHFIRNRSRAALQGIGDVRTAIELATGHSEEQVARAHVAAVQRQFTDQQIMAGVGEYLVQTQRHQPRPPLAFSGTTGVALACWVVGRLSGVTFIRRRVPDITRLNTGADTRPPK